MRSHVFRCRFESRKVAVPRRARFRAMRGSQSENRRNASETVLPAALPSPTTRSCFNHAIIWRSERLATDGIWPNVFVVPSPTGIRSYLTPKSEGHFTLVVSSQRMAARSSWPTISATSGRAFAIPAKAPAESSASPQTMRSLCPLIRLVSPSRTRGDHQPEKSDVCA